MAGMPFTYVPPTGWELMETVQITVGNQDMFPSAISCSLLDQHAQHVNGPDGTVEYRPPVGWWVVMISRLDTGEVDQVWISPSGDIAIQVNACTGASMGGSGAFVKIIYFVLAGLGIGFILAPLFKKKGQ